MRSLLSLSFLAATAIYSKTTFAAVEDSASREALGKRSTTYTSAPYYPAPPGGWVSEWEASYAKAQAIVEQMTLAEKVNITTGTGYWMGPCSGNTGSALRFNISNICLQDSALGVAHTDNITVFPAGITVGATFDKSLMYKRGAALGIEARGKGVNVQLGPTVGPLGRKPRGGRNWEGFGADPVLQAYGGAQTIKGMQDQGVIATIKHFIGNEQEKYRMDTGVMQAYSANIDDRTLHELYAWPFAEGIRAGVGALMTSYNDVNASKCSQNAWLINNIIKDELGFQGFVMSDWLAQRGGVSSALAGLDMAMPGDAWLPLLGNAYWASNLSKMVLNGTLPLTRLNDMVTRILAARFQMGQDEDYPDVNFSSNTSDEYGELYPAALLSPSGKVNWYVSVQADHYIVARQVAQDGITLLKNEDSILPLNTTTTLHVFGTDARKNPNGINACTDRSCNKGTLGTGWGSGTADYMYLSDPITAIQNRSSSVVTHFSDTFPSSLTGITSSDVAIVFITSDSGENSYTVESNHGDRDSSGLTAWHSGNTLVTKAAAKFDNVIVVAHTVGPIVIDSWVELDSVKAVLFAHLPGQEAGESLASVLYGDVSPSGHLPYSIPKSEDDYPDSLSLVGFSLSQVEDTYSEGLYIDYRYLNKHGITPRYAFGHGLSYTTFNFSSPTLTTVGDLTTTPPARTTKGSTPSYSTDIPAASEVAWPSGLTHIWRYLYPYLDDPDSISSTGTYNYPTGYQTTAQPDPVAGGAQGGNPALFDIMFNVSVTVTNTGNCAGKAVAQLYVQPADNSTLSVDMPIIQLRDFAKTETELEAGESQTLELSVTRKDLSYWDVTEQNWLVPTKKWVLWVGEASDNLDVACYTSTGECETNVASPV